MKLTVKPPRRGLPQSVHYSEMSGGRASLSPSRRKRQKFTRRRFTVGSNFTSGLALHIQDADHLSRSILFINTNAPNSIAGCEPAIGRLSSVPSYTPDRTGGP